jgi:hypothetical protein
MSRSPLEGRRIAVEHRANGYFVGNVPVILPSDDRWSRKPRGPWKLHEETAIGLGLAEQITTSVTFGTITEPITWVSRSDKAVRLHLCTICRSLFIAYYSTHQCSEACVRASRKAWHEAHRRPSSSLPSKAAARRTALAEATCQACGTPIAAKRLTARFCSGRCRQKHHRNAH